MFAPTSPRDRVDAAPARLKAPGVTRDPPPSLSTRHTTWALFGLMLCLSFSSSSYGVVLPSIVEQFGISLAQAGAVSTLRGLGGLGALIVGGILMDRLGKRRTVLIAAALFSIGLLTITGAPFFSIVLLGFAIFGGGGSLLDATANAAIADLHVENRRQYIALLYSLFSVGALVGPATIGAALSIGISWQAVYIGLAAATLCVGLFFRSASLAIPVLHRQPTSQVTQRDQQKSLKPLAVGAATLAVYYGSQITTAAWMPMYFSTELHSGPLVAGLSVTLFWTGIGIGRSRMRRITERIGERRLVQIAGFVSTPFMIGALLWESPWPTLVMILITGIFSGPIYPACMNYAFNQYPEGTGKASAFMTISATLTGLAVPYITGVWAESFGLKLALWIIPALLFLSSLIGLLLPIEPDCAKDTKSAL